MDRKLKYEEFYKDEEVIIGEGGLSQTFIRKKFDLEAYTRSGTSHPIVEFILIFLSLIYFAYGAYNVYLLGGYLKSLIVSHKTELDIIIALIKEYYNETLFVLTIAYIFTLWISYMVVKWFSRFASVFLYGSFVLKIIFFVALYFLIQWKYSWVFLVPAGIEALLLLFWRNKIGKAAMYIKIGGMAVCKERKLLIPQAFQTMWITLLIIGHVVVTYMTFSGANNFSINIFGYTVNEIHVYAVYTFLFVFLVYVVVYATLIAKQLMIHHWYRGGELEYWTSVKMTRKRWRGIFGYAFSSTVIHIFQVILKILRREVKPENLLEAAKFTYEITPDNPMALDTEEGKSHVIEKKEKRGKGLFGLIFKRGKFERKKIPLRERIWMGLNYFTLPAIAVEDKNFIPAVWKSVKMVIRSIPDLYIKKAHVNKLFRLMQYSAVILSVMGGAVFGWIYAKFMAWNQLQTYAAVGGFAFLFFIIGGSTSALVINDLNMTYITLMYIHTLDEMNGKTGYTRFDLEKQEVLEKKLREKIKKKLEKKKRKEEKKKRKRLKKLGGVPPEEAVSAVSSETAGTDESIESGISDDGRDSYKNPI